MAVAFVVMGMMMIMTVIMPVAVGVMMVVRIVVMMVMLIVMIVITSVNLKLVRVSASACFAHSILFNIFITDLLAPPLFGQGWVLTQ
jgi:hypothetical protein